MCKTFFLTDTKKYEGVFLDGAVEGLPQRPYGNQEERFDFISDIMVNIITKLGVKHVFVEGYSMGSKGAVFNIGENTGLLKHKLWKAGISITSVPPTVNKKSWTGKGNAKKDAMYTEFLERTGVDLVKALDYKPVEIGSPVGDIVDSYSIMCYGLDSMNGTKQ